MLKFLSSRAGIQPHLTNHCLRATSVTIFSDNNCETRHIKSVNDHKSDHLIESYNNRPSLDQQREMSKALSSFLYGHEAISADKENTAGRQLDLQDTSSSTTAIQAYLASFLVQHNQEAVSNNVRITHMTSKGCIAFFPSLTFTTAPMCKLTINLAEGVKLCIVNINRKSFRLFKQRKFDNDNENFNGRRI